ncbi:MAG: hypothetical protein KBT77_08925 [Thalassolituus oleivorans]|uniref:hypothetical protein n=1 Tax=Thalassolituus oleivorans TaxID=187493 RepID=UPI001B5878F9|nr:hypothetical protein [Thalassolituus oleivorans]MBQ0727458.1 hypothetical protein [Thalassolituus oleivorans]MBQ0780803.1 hypothetical protein [Thalassolituus oleivorans]
MKSLLFALFFICFAPSVWCDSTIQYNNTSQTYHFPEKILSSTELFNEFSSLSGIQIFYDPQVVVPDLLRGSNLSEDAVLRFLDQNFSIIKTFNDQKNIITLQVLPKGEYQRSTLIKANDDSSTPHLTDQSIEKLSTQESEQRQLVLKAKALREAARLDAQEKHEENRSHSKEEREAHEKKRLKKENELKNEAITELKKFKKTDPEIYDRLLMIHKSRYPNIEAELTDNSEGSSTDD